MVVRGVHATWGVVATKMSEWPPLESLTPLKIRPSQEDSNLTHFSHNLCRVTFIFKINMYKEYDTLFIGDDALENKKQQ